MADYDYEMVSSSLEWSITHSIFSQIKNEWQADTPDGWTITDKEIVSCQLSKKPHIPLLLNLNIYERTNDRDANYTATDSPFEFLSN